MVKQIKYLFALLLITFLLGFFFLKDQFDNRLHLYFCDVGQGDAIYIRLPDKTDLLIDGGPNQSVLHCLGRFMPFYDRKIETVILTHPEADHLNGLLAVLKRYQVEYLVTTPVANSSQNYQKLLDLVAEKQIKVKNFYAGEQIQFGLVQFIGLWPQKNWLVSQLNCLDSQLCVSLAKGEDKVLGVGSTTRLNDFSIVGLLSFGAFDVLLTADAESQIQEKILADLPKLTMIDNQLEVFKVSHHGAKNSLNEHFLAFFKPELAVVSVGKNNRYGHPHPNLLAKLNEIGLPLLRTDETGTIEIVSNGQNWQVQKHPSD